MDAQVATDLAKAYGNLVNQVGFAAAVAGILVVAILVVIFILVRWGIRTGDRLADRFIGHVDALDKNQEKFSPQLDRIEEHARQARCQYGPPPPDARSRAIPAPQG